MRPSGRTAEREAVEFEPARAYISQLRYDSLTFVSGYTSELDRLEDQVPAVLADIDEALKTALTRWKHVAKLSVYLSRSQSLELLKELLRKANRLDLARIEFEFVDGFARDKVLFEAEATASIAG